MIEQNLVIKALYVQNGLMITIFGVIFFLILLGIWKKNFRFVGICSLWIVLFFWFFNSQFWGFSALTLKDERIYLRYGLCSIFKNKSVSTQIRPKIESDFSGFPQYKHLYFLVIGNYKSMGVEKENKEVLEEIIDRLEKRY